MTSLSMTQNSADIGRDLPCLLDLECDNPARLAEARAWLQFVGLNWCELIVGSKKEVEAWVAGGFALPPGTHRNWRY